MPRAIVSRQTSPIGSWTPGSTLRGVTPPGPRAPFAGGRGGALFTPPKAGASPSSSGNGLTRSPSQPSPSPGGRQPSPSPDTAGRGVPKTASPLGNVRRPLQTTSTPEKSVGKAASVPATPERHPAGGVGGLRSPGAVPVGSGLAAAAHGRRGVLGKEAGGMTGNTWPGATSRIGDSVVSSLGQRPSPQRTRETGGRSLLPAKTVSHDYTVVFDLDETLVSNRMAGFRPAIKRPHLEPLLRSLQGKAEMVLWTASIESVGRPVLRQIDPNGEFFNHAIYRDPAWFQERPNVPHHKDLRLLGRDLSKVIIVENNPFSVRLQKRNAVLVPDFDRPNPTDSALRRLEGLLGELLSSGKEVSDYIPQSGQVQPMRLMRPYGLYGGVTGMGIGGRGSTAGGGKAQEPFYYLNDARRTSRV
eukprot:Hpha_TRINITY_DN16453_c1_g14::TRINITY_DN16453_c1_g14_i1::g.161256::m.161256